MNLMHVVLILTVFIPTMVYSRGYNSKELARELEDLFLESRAAAKISSQCDWITYQSVLGAGATYDPKSYPCEKKTLVGGYCVLPYSKAVALCNSDPTCGGLAITTNRNWHNSYDTNNEASVHLYAVGAKRDSAANREWTALDKKCWHFNT